MISRSILTLLMLLSMLSTGCAGPVDFLASRIAVSAPPEAYSEPSDGFRYVRSTLSSQEQYVYDQLAAGLASHAACIDDLYPDAALIQKVIEAIDRDYPEFFWFCGNGKIETSFMSDNPVKAAYYPVYTVDEAEQSRLQARINAWEETCLFGLPENAGDYEKALYVYQYIIDHADYQVVDNNSIVHIMVDGKGLCGCYSKTAQYLLNRMGVPCAYISGQAGGESHAWNLIWLDGTPCWMDVTWGDPVFDGGDPNDGPAFEYFGITTEDLLRNHTIDPSVPVPDCVSQEYNYFRRNGLFYDSYDPASIRENMIQALLHHATRLSLRFADDVYPEAVSALFELGDVHPLLSDAARAAGAQQPGDSLWYSKNDAFCTVTVKLTSPG